MIVCPREDDLREKALLVPRLERAPDKSLNPRGCLFFLAMSSLAAARADNFYHPPDWDPRKSSRAEHSEGGRKPLSKEEVEKAKLTFHKWDKNGDKKISIEEFGAAWATK